MTTKELEGARGGGGGLIGLRLIEGGSRSFRPVSSPQSYLVCLRKAIPGSCKLGGRDTSIVTDTGTYGTP